MSSNKKKLSAGVVYVFSLVLLVMGLISYKPDSFLLSIVFFNLSIILFSLAATSQLIDYRPDSKIYYFTVLFIITAPLSIYSVGLLIKLYKLNLVKFGTSGDWIGFAGSIIGGAMTMFALIFTIQHEQEKRKQEKIDQLKPYIDIDLVRIDQNENYVTSDYIDNHFELRMNVSNISSNNLRDFEMTRIERSIEGIQKDTQDMIDKERIFDALLVTQYGKKGLIKANDTKKSFLCFEDYNDPKIKKGTSRKLKIRILSQYIDVSGNGPYTHETIFIIIHSVVRDQFGLHNNFVVEKVTNKAL